MSASSIVQQGYRSYLGDWPRMLFVPTALLGAWAIAAGWPVGHWEVQAVWTVVTGYALFCAGSCYHEAVHHTLHGSRTLSLWTGRLLGLVLLVPFHVYREVHIRHHAYMNSPADWELWPYSDPKASLTFRRVFVWLDLVLGSFTAPYIYNRIFFHPQSPIKSQELRRTIWWEFAASAIVWAGLIALVAYYGAWATFFWAWLLPLGVAGGFQTGRKLTEHLGMASYDPLLGTRTVISQDWPSKVLGFFHFDIFIHGVHHRHPRLSHNELKPTMEDYAEHDPEIGVRLYPYYVLAMLDMLPTLFRNPGTGMNVGAAPPSFKDCEEVQTFLTDVTKEVLEQPPEEKKVGRLTVHESQKLTDRERQLLGESTLDYFAHYAACSTDRTRLFFVKVYRRDALLGVAPVIKTIKYNGTRLLQPRLGRWLGPLLGPLARTTTYTVDTSLLAFQYRTPFFCLDDADLPLVRQAVSNHLKSKQDGDNVFIGEPLAETAWTADEGYDTFLSLPMAQIDVSSHDSFESYLGSLSKKRRKNVRQARREFDQAGAVLETLEPPLSSGVLDEMAACLKASADHSALAVPWDDVGNSPEALRTLPQTVLAVRVDGRLVAFMSFITCGDELLQCHGGLDYDVSHAVKAYHNLMTAAVEHAISRGFSRVSFGPLNNETKRRGADQLLPVAGNVWARNPMLRPFNRRVLIPNFQVFTGPLPSAGTPSTSPSSTDEKGDGPENPPRSSREPAAARV